MKTQLNRRKFLALATATTAGGIFVPKLIKASSGPVSGGTPALPYVYEQAYYVSISSASGTVPFPADMPYQHGINEAFMSMSLGSIGQFTPPTEVVPSDYQASFDLYAVNNPPAGFMAVSPQVAILELILGVAVLAGGAYVVYKLYKWAQQIPPPDTNTTDSPNVAQTY